jgi:FkbM family methyltransferase
LGLYRHSRNAFHRVVRPRLHAQRRRQRDFFAQLITPGALAFDVGANNGHLSAVLLDVGARVVSVEPNPELAAAIQRRYGRELTVEPVAVGEEIGRLPLHLGAVRDAHSTLSDEWIDRVGRPLWTDSVSVPVVTLDGLITQHGVPQFIKLDIEGFELQALRGLSASIDGLCFEYHPIAIDIALACVERAVELGFRSFNETPGDTPNFAGDWLSPDEFSSRLSRSHSDDPNTYGDIYALSVSGDSGRTAC